MLLCEQEQQDPFSVRYRLPYTFNVVAKRTRDQSPPRRNTRRKFTHHSGLVGPIDPIGPATSCSVGPSTQDQLSSGSSGGLGNVSSTSQTNNPTVPPASASAQDLASPAPQAESSRPVGIPLPSASIEDPMDGQNAVIEGTNPGRGPTTGGIEIWIYGSNLPNGSTPLYARFGEHVTRVVSASELLWVFCFDLIHSRAPFNLAYCPVNCRPETVRAGFRLPSPEDLLPTLLLLEKVSVNLTITSTSMKRKPGAFLVFAHLPSDSEWQFSFTSSKPPIKSKRLP